MKRAAGENGIVAERITDKLQQECERRGLGLVTGTRCSVEKLPFLRNLFLGGNVLAPWALIDAAWCFLESWDAAAALWRYDLLADGVGTPGERKMAQVVIGDLRQPVYSPEMVFIHNNKGGQAFYRAWRGEDISRGDAEDAEKKGMEAHLAFLVALHQVKPVFLELPGSWLIEGGSIMAQEFRTAKPTTNLVRVEISKGRFVMCRPGEERETLRHFQEMAGGRRQ